MSTTSAIHGSNRIPLAAFDTLAYAKKLKAAGFTEKQAEGQAEAIYEIIDQKLATKRDLHDLANMLTIRFGGMLAAAIMIMAALVKLL